MKKVVNSVLASALALTVAPMVVGAEETNAPKMDEGLQKVVNRLNALGVVQGYGDGDFKVDQTINRAEFATLIVRIRGLEQGAKIAQFQSTFTDVNAGDWFAGFVNVASGQDIIKGFPDKSFRPKNEVTYAEAVTMIVRALGYETSVRGVWPNNMIAKASELNIAKTITNPNVAATRGDIFKMLDNALRVKLMEQIEYGTNTTFNITDQTLLTRYMKVEVRDMEWAREQKNSSDDLPFVTNVPVIGLGSLKANEVTLNGKNAGLGSNVTYKVAEGINPNDFDGQHVQVWLKNDSSNTIVWMEGSEDEEVVMDRLDKFLLGGTELKDPEKIKNDSDVADLEIEVEGSGRTYRFTKNTKVTYNFKPENSLAGAMRKIAADNTSFGAKIVLDNSRDISYIHVIDDVTLNKSIEGTKYGSKVIEKIDADKKKISNLDSSSFKGLEGKDEGRDFLVFRDNKPAKLADLKPLDVYSVYYADGKKDRLLVFATSTVVEGKVDKITMRSDIDNRLVIGDKTYRFRKGATFSDDGNKEVTVLEEGTWDKVRNLDGETVKLHLDAAGRIRHIETGDNISDRRFKAVVISKAEKLRGKWEFEVIGQNGKKYDIDLKADKIIAKNGKAYDNKANDEKDIAKDFVPSKDKDKLLLLEVSVDSKGAPEKVKVLDTVIQGPLEKGAWFDAADKDDEMIVTSKGDYQVTKDTAIFDMTGAIKNDGSTLQNAGIAKFKDIAEKKDLKVFYTVDKKDNDVEAIFVVDGKTLTSKAKFGLFVQTGRSGKDQIDILTKDEDNKLVLKTFNLNGDTEDLWDNGIERGDFIRFSLNNDDEVVINDIVPIVHRADDIKKVKLYDDGKLEDVNVEKLRVAKVTKATSTRITYEYKDEDKKTRTEVFNVNSKTGYINAYDLKEADGVDEDDLIVLVDTDEKGSNFDYVLTVIGLNDFKKEFSKDEREELEARFLGLDNKVKQPKPEEPEPVDLVKEDSLKAVASSAFGIGAYTVEGEGENGAEVEATIEVNGKKYSGTATVKNGKFKIEFPGRPGATEYSLKATKSGQKTVELTGLKFDEE